MEAIEEKKINYTDMVFHMMPEKFSAMRLVNVPEANKDCLGYLSSEENYYKTCDFIAFFASRLVNSKLFPVEREIPANMKEEIEYYFSRKERPF